MSKLSSEVRTTYTTMDETANLRGPNPIVMAAVPPSETSRGFSEFIGTFIYVIILNGAYCQSYLIEQENNKNQMEREASNMHFLSTLHSAFGIALAATMGMFVSHRISGGHLNPIISLVFCLIDKMSWELFPYYIIPQFLGAFFGALIVYLGYYPALQNVHEWDQNISGLFASYSHGFENTGSSFTYLFLASIAFLTILFGLCDLEWKKRNRLTTDIISYRLPSPIKVGLIYFAIALSWSYSTSFALNPAADFGCRLFSALAMWSGRVFQYSNYFFWVPLISPFIGSLVVGGFYAIFMADNSII